MSSDRGQQSAEVFGLLAQLVHRAQQDAERALRAAGLTVAQFQLLRLVRARPGVVQRAVGAHFAVSDANVSMLVAKLETAGLLQRDAAGAANRLRLTASGTALVERLEPEHDEYLRGVFAGLTDTQLRRLSDLVRRVLEGWTG